MTQNKLKTTAFFVKQTLNKLCKYQRYITHLQRTPVMENGVRFGN